MSSAYEGFAKQTMVLYAKGKLIDYVGIDGKTGRYRLSIDIAASSCSVSDSFRHKIG